MIYLFYPNNTISQLIIKKDQFDDITALRPYLFFISYNAIHHFKSIDFLKLYSKALFCFHIGLSKICRCLPQIYI